MNKELEAKSWLLNSRNSSPFATNRFEDVQDAVAFIDSLYSHGALFVEVDNIDDEPERIQEEGGPYADSLIIYLPKEPQLRQKLYSIINIEADNQGLEHVEDIGNATETLWWD